MPAVILVLGSAALICWAPGYGWIIGAILFAIGMLFLLEGR